jgi:twitching motility protein PilT
VDLQVVLQAAVKAGASDVHLKVGMPPMFRLNGSLKPVRDAQRLSPEELSKIASAIMTSQQRERFKQQLDLDMAYGVPAVGRFRVNVFLQRGCVGMVFRVIPYKVPAIGDLYLPKVITTIAEERRGLVLVTGATGSGKSSTLAAMIDYINATRTSHVVTIEDPIEFLVRDKRSIVSQREIGTDALTFSSALRAALRQDPDVVLVGEMRDLETIEIALHAAETGHLVMSTLHTMTAGEAITRVVSAFPVDQHQHARVQLAALIKAIICQRLVPRKDGTGRVPAVEVMRSTARMRELILDERRYREIEQAIGEGQDTYGMQTFDQSLHALLKAGLISYEEALLQASNPEDFALRVSGIEATTNSGDDWSQFRPPERSAGATTTTGGLSGAGDMKIERF